MTRLLEFARHSLDSTRAGPVTAVGIAVLAALMAAGAACGAPGGPDNVVSVLPDDAVAVPTQVRPSAQPTPTPNEGAETLIERIIRDGDPRELDSFRQLLRRDSIEPIYEPQFVAQDEADLEPSELVMGVSINGDSRAYPIRYLRWREMVNDEVGGLPILVTW
jgi:hypothetical protein